MTSDTGHFGVQWTLFSRTQLDSETGQPISRDRFLRTTGWRPEEIAGRRVLDAGCGAGRFAEVALSCGARLVAVDASIATAACRANLAAHSSLQVVQADIERLPFREASFDFVYCLGVLQHTKDVRRAFLSLTRQLAPGGRIAVDLYPRLFLNRLWPKYWLRPITRRMSSRALWAAVQRLFPWLYPVSLGLGRIPRLGHWARHAVPVVNYEGILPLSAAQLREWALLDTFDMLGPAYDQPQDVPTLRGWFEEAGLTEIEVCRRGLVIGRGRRAA